MLSLPNGTYSPVNAGLRSKIRSPRKLAIWPPAELTCASVASGKMILTHNGFLWITSSACFIDSSHNWPFHSATSA